MKKLFTFIVLSISANLLFAQNNFDNFSTLKAKGKIPKEFLTLSTDKFEEDFEKNKNKELDKDFFLSTRFIIDDLLLSGNILFNETMSNYVNKVARYVLISDKKLYNELQFYVLKSNAVNAFSTDQGIIFVTTGLLAQLENEAQLAFILAHEVAHYTEKHVRNGYVDKQNIVKGKGKYRGLNYSDKIDELSTYSKDKEFEADRLGLKFYQKTMYDIEEVYTSFGVLLYSYLPFEEIQFDTNYFNTDFLYIPGGAFPDTINQITKEEDFDDELSSHPNIKKRMDAIIDELDNFKSKGDLKFKISEDEFNQVKTLAQFESVNIHLYQREYVDALYATFLLERRFENNKFLEFSKAKALYGLAKYKNHHRYNEVTRKLKKTEGEMYKLAVFIKELDREQINVIAYRHIYDLSIKYKNDTYIKKYERDMMKEIAINSSINLEDLIDVDFKTYNDSIKELRSQFDIQDSIAKVDASDLSKYKKIKLKKELYKLEQTGGLTPGDYYKTALSDLIQSGQFKKDFKYYQAQEELREVAEADNANDKNEPTYLGIKKLVVIDPYIADYSLKGEVKKVKSENQKVELYNAYSRDYHKLDLTTSIVDSKNLTQSDVDKYNELGLFNNWIGEIFEHDEIEMISSLNDQVHPLNDKYGTEHYLFTGLFKSKDRHEFSMMHLYGILFFYTAPLAIADLLIIHNYFEMVAISINSETDQIEYYQNDEINLKANKLVMQAYIYNLLYNLNKTKK